MGLKHVIRASTKSHLHFEEYWLVRLRKIHEYPRGVLNLPWLSTKFL